MRTRIAVATIFLASALNAQAETTVREAQCAPRESHVSDPRFPLAILEIEFSGFHGTSRKPDLSIWRQELTFRFERKISRRVYALFGITGANTNLTYRDVIEIPEDAGASITEARLHANVQARYNRMTSVGLRAILWTNEAFSLYLGGMLASMAQTHAEIEGAYIITPPLSVNIAEIAKDYVTIEYDWMRFDTTLRLDWTTNLRGRLLSPYAELGAAFVQSKVALAYDDGLSRKLGQTAEALGTYLVLPKGPELSTAFPYLSVGLEVQVAGPVYARFGISTLPFGKQIVDQTMRNLGVSFVFKDSD